jgi:hypothetical protein
VHYNVLAKREHWRGQKAADLEDRSALHSLVHPDHGPADLRRVSHTESQRFTRHQPARSPYPDAPYARFRGQRRVWISFESARAVSQIRG